MQSRECLSKVASGSKVQGPRSSSAMKARGLLCGAWLRLLGCSPVPTGRGFLPLQVTLPSPANPGTRPFRPAVGVVTIMRHTLASLGAGR